MLLCSCDSGRPTLVGLLNHPPTQEKQANKETKAKTHQKISISFLDFLGASGCPKTAGEQDAEHTPSSVPRQYCWRTWSRESQVEALVVVLLCRNSLERGVARLNAIEVLSRGGGLQDHLNDSFTNSALQHSPMPGTLVDSGTALEIPRAPSLREPTV